MKNRFEHPFRYYLLVMILTPLGLLSIVYLNFHLLYKQALDNAFVKCASNTEQISANFNNMIHKSHLVINTLVKDVEFMMMEKTSAEKILQYITVRNSFYTKDMKLTFNSLYGYIKDSYVDSVQWVPPKWYQPKLRPWYLGAKKRPGKVVLIPPYVDAETGKVVVSLALMLSDGKGVLSLDHFFDDIAGNNDKLFQGSGEWFLLDTRGNIINSQLKGNQKQRSIVEHRIFAKALRPFMYRAMGGEKLPEMVVVNGKKCSLLYSELINDWRCVTVIYHDKLALAVCYSLFYHFMAVIIITLMVWIFLTIGIYRIQCERMRAIEAEKAKSFFFATVSHDIRTPLNSIIGFSELLRKKDVDQKVADEYLNHIISSGKILIQLINDILDLSKLDAEKLEYHYEMCDFTQVVVSTMDSFIPVASEGKNELKIEIEDNFPVVKIDEQRIRQILFNLIGNAVKFTRSGIICVQASFQRKTQKSGWLIFSVTDTGIGISQDSIKKIIDPFVQIGHSTKGTGLGLGICNKLIAQMGGNFDIQSEEGKGSSFIVTLQDVEYTQETPAPTVDITETTVIPVQKEGKFKFLLVDDIDLNLKVLSLMLKNVFNADFTLAHTGAEALALLKGNTFDAILTDIWMPEMGGEELVKIIRKTPEFADLKVYAISADVNFVKNWQNIGFSGLILKPVTLESIQEFRNNFLEAEEQNS